MNHKVQDIFQFHESKQLLSFFPFLIVLINHLVVLHPCNQGLHTVRQELSPVNSYVTPIPDEVPGYEDKLIMAGGTFIEGSTIELSADGPVREPYAVYMQGGLTYSHVKIVLKNIFERVNQR